MTTTAAGVGSRGGSAEGEATCFVCGRPAIRGGSLCFGCRNVYRPWLKGDRPARLRYLRDTWDGEYRCAYTGVALDPSDRSSPRYAEWTLRVPGDPSSVVLVASLVNRMKAGLREDEFMAMVRALADRFERDRPSPRPFDEGAFPERPIAASSQV